MYRITDKYTCSEMNRMGTVCMILADTDGNWDGRGKREEGIGRLEVTDGHLMITVLIK